MTTMPELRAAVARGTTATDATTVTSAVAGAGPTAAGWHALLALESHARAEMVGAGRLQELIEDPLVTDVLVNGTRGVWVDRGAGLVRRPVDLGGEPRVRALATRLAAACGQRLDEACPVVDGALPDGTRLHAVLPPISADGTLISLRTQRGRAMTVEELVAGGTVAADLADVLRGLVVTRANVLVSGAAGAGKTTLLAALLSTVGPHERIVCIEEAVELRPDHPHVVHLQVRRANVQQAGGVDMAALVRAAMRMRPDRLVLGECRGAEVREVLGALNTGHDGGWATVHANAPADVPARLIALGSLAGLGEHAVAVQAVSALDAVLHVSRTEQGRRLTEIGVLARHGPDLVCDTALRVTGSGEVREGPAWSALADRLDRREPR